MRDADIYFVGTVVLMCDEKVEPQQGKDLLKGKPDKLNSAFHLTYVTASDFVIILRYFL